MYEGSFPIRISTKLFKLFLNCVIAVSGRFLLVKSFTSNTFYKITIFNIKKAKKQYMYVI